LSKDGIIPPTKDALRTVSAEPVAAAPSQPSPRSQSMPNPEPDTPSLTSGQNANGQHANGQETKMSARRRSKSAGFNALIQEADKRKGARRALYNRANHLLASIKRHRQQNRMVQNTIASLRQLQNVDA